MLEAAKAAIDGGRNQYPPGAGVPELLTAIAAHQDALLRAVARPGDAGARDGGRDRGDRVRGPGALRARRRGGDVRALLRLLRRDDRPRGGDPPHVGAALPRLRGRRGVAASGVLVADPSRAAQHAAQPDGEGLHPRRARARRVAGPRARCVGRDRRGLRAPRLRRCRARRRSRRCPAWRSGP